MDCGQLQYRIILLRNIEEICMIDPYTKLIISRSKVYMWELSILTGEYVEPVSDLKFTHI